jgi:HSP20 family protein
MTITYNQLFARPQNDVRQVFNRYFVDTEQNAGWTPRVDVREEDNRFVIFADVPGVAPVDIEISMDKNLLTIKGERKSDIAAGEGAKLTRVERRQGAFQRSFALPETADAEGITAAGKNGVLEISIPKKAQAAPRRIEITH